MEYQKIINLLDNTTNQAPNFKSKNWVKINDKTRGTYNEDNQIRFKTSVLRSSSCDYSNSYLLVKRTITIRNTATQGAENNAANKNKVIFKNCVPFTNCISRITNTQVDNALDSDVVIPMYNVIEYSNNYSKRFGILWQYCRDERATNVANETIVDFKEDNITIDLFKIKEKIAD